MITSARPTIEPTRVKVCAMRHPETREWLHFGGELLTEHAAWRWLGTPEQAANLRRRSKLARSLTVITTEPKQERL